MKAIISYGEYESVAFDTLLYANKLKEVGVPAKQAEVMVEIQAEIIENNLATKQDIALTQRDVKELDVRLSSRVKELEMSLTIRLGGMMAASIAIVAALVKLL